MSSFFLLSVQLSQPYVSCGRGYLVIAAEFPVRSLSTLLLLGCDVCKLYCKLLLLQYKIRCFLMLKSLKSCKREMKSLVGSHGPVSDQTWYCTNYGCNFRLVCKLINRCHSHKIKMCISSTHKKQLRTVENRPNHLYCSINSVTKTRIIDNTYTPV